MKPLKGQGVRLDGGYAHCALGAVGAARWGDQWDGWASRGESGGGDLYAMLMRDPLTGPIVKQLAQTLVAHNPEYFGGHADDEDNEDAYATAYATVYSWNDSMADRDKVKDVLAAVKYQFEQQESK